MDRSALLGLFAGSALLLYALFSRGSLLTFWDPSSLLIVFGGTLAAVTISFKGSRLLNIPSYLRKAFGGTKKDPRAIRERIVNLAQRARREGLLALEDDLEDIENRFLRKAVQLLVDATPSEQLKEVLDNEIDTFIQSERHGIAVFSTAGGMSPAFGMIGTLIGLIEMLKDLDNPDSVGGGMAVALITTLYGTLLANMFFNPVANKLEERKDDEVRIRRMVIRGIMAIQDGQNPRLIGDQLDALLTAREAEEPDEETEDLQPEEEVKREVASDD